MGLTCKPIGKMKQVLTKLTNQIEKNRIETEKAKRVRKIKKISKLFIWTCLYGVINKSIILRIVR